MRGRCGPPTLQAYRRAACFAIAEAGSIHQSHADSVAFPLGSTLGGLCLPRALANPEFYLNRSLSWLAFNRRVLEEAEDESNPLLERVKFLAITASNLDEFFEIRIAGLLQHLEEGQVEAGPDGLTPMDEQELVAEATHRFVREQYECWNEKLLPALAEHASGYTRWQTWTMRSATVVDDYCRNELDALLTPVTVDPAHPFPRVIHKALCQALLLRRRRRSAANATTWEW